MHVIADLQLHSRFSRAVSKDMTIPNIALWAARKGIGLVATGDWTHPMWMREIKEHLEETGTGLLRLKKSGSELRSGQNLIDPLRAGQFTSDTVLQSTDNSRIEFPDAKHEKRSAQILPLTAQEVTDPLFLLATEVSSIYKQGIKTRRVHTLIWVPSLDSADKIAKEMTRQGCNLLSDGRPIIGLTCQQIAELVFTIDPRRS